LRSVQVNNSLDKFEVFGDEIIAIIHDEDLADVELGVVASFLGSKRTKDAHLETKRMALNLSWPLMKKYLTAR
jgi:hypothetical protein